MPGPTERGERLGTVLRVLYLIFNEGYTASSGAGPARAELTGEAIRLARILRGLLPDDGEVTGLLALMLLTDAHRAARVGPDGELVPLAEQDRSRWDSAAIAEGVALITEALTWSPPGPYQLQAAIAAVHAEASTAAETDWRQIVALYRLLARVAPNPMVTLNQAVAVAMVAGPRAGLALLAPLDADEARPGTTGWPPSGLTCWSWPGRSVRRREAYLVAARGTTSRPEQRYLEVRAARLRD